METLSLPSEKRTHYQLEAKVTADGRPVILSVNVTNGLSRKISVSAKLSNVFSKDASFSGKTFRNSVFWNSRFIGQLSVKSSGAKLAICVTVDF